MTQLLVTTSPRGVHLWAPTPTDAEEVRRITGGRPVDGEELRGELFLDDSDWGMSDDDVARYVTWVDPGFEAQEACGALVGAGHTLAWHQDQFPGNRDGDRLGVPVQGSLTQEELRAARGQ